MFAGWRAPLAIAALAGAGAAAWAVFSQPGEESVVGTLGSASAQPVVETADAEAEPIELEWIDLMPNGAQIDPESNRVFRIVEHGEEWAGPESVELVDGYNGKMVRLPGYMVPLEFEEDGVRNFLLVPFVGACIHVPPPPANQIVLVTSETPYPAQDYFDAVTVTGVFDHLGADLDLAEVGYIIEATQVLPYSR